MNNVHVFIRVSIMINSLKLVKSLKGEQLKQYCSIYETKKCFINQLVSQNITFVQCEEST